MLFTRLSQSNPLPLALSQGLVVGMPLNQLTGADVRDYAEQGKLHAFNPSRIGRFRGAPSGALLIRSNRKVCTICAL